MSQSARPRTATPVVLAALALSPRAAAVAVEAQRWAQRLGGELVLLHVGPDEPATRQRLEQILAENDVSGARLEFRRGKPGRALVQAAAEFHAELIVAGALEKEGLLTYYVGSVARQVARHAPCSVLLLTEPRLEPTALRRWVVSTRFDEISASMLQFVGRLAQQEQPERIDVVSEYELRGATLALVEAGAEEQQRRIQLQEEVRLADFLAEHYPPGPRVCPVSLRGRIGYESSAYARREAADLLVAPAPRSLGFWDKFIQHGVEFALEALPCAFLLFRERLQRKSGRTTPTAGGR